MKPTKIIAFLVIGVGALDLLAGNSDHPLLPDSIANHLDQQTDALLIGVGVILLVWF
jgi:hypothetical protein